MSASLKKIKMLNKELQKSKNPRLLLSKVVNHPDIKRAICSQKKASNAIFFQRGRKSHNRWLTTATRIRKIQIVEVEVEG